MTPFIPTRLEQNCSFRNTWRSFLRYFDERWPVEYFPTKEYPIYYSDCLTEIDEERVKDAKAVIIFSFNTFSGGRGSEDHEFMITVRIKRDENIYDSIALNVVDAIMDVFDVSPFSGGYIPLYNFYTPDGVETRATASPTGDDFPLIPIFSRVETDDSYDDYETFKTLHVYINVKVDRSNRTIDLQS